MTNKKYKIIYCDPPWDYGTSKLNARTNGKELHDHYDTMTIDKLKQLPIKELADSNSVIFMWVVYTKLKESIELMESWGFKYVTVGFEWIKKTPNNNLVNFMGGVVTGGAVELCLFGRRGHLKRQRKDISRMIVCPRKEHSKKPHEARLRIVQLFGDLSRIELFSRYKEEGWDIWGNELHNDIEIVDN